MRKFAFSILIVLIIYVAIGALATWLLPHWFTTLRRLDIVRIFVQLLGAISTLSAVLWALFGSSVLRKIRSSYLDLHLEKNSEHCYLVADVPEIPSETKMRLGIFARVTNQSPVDAESCQAVTNEIFASSDGIKFSSFQKVCTASFTWVYDGKCETTVRKGVDKHFKFVELLEKTTAAQFSPNGKIVKPESKSISIFVNLPNFLNNQDSFEIGSDYKGVMIPVSLVSKTEDVRVYYLKVVWLGSELKDYMTADKLKVMILTESVAKQDIV